MVKEYKNVNIIINFLINNSQNYYFNLLKCS